MDHILRFKKSKISLENAHLVANQESLKVENNALKFYGDFWVYFLYLFHISYNLHNIRCFE